VNSRSALRDALPIVIGALGRAVARLFGISADLLFPLGAIVMLALLLYRRFKEDLFTVSRERLEELLVEAQLELGKAEESLRRHQEIMDKVKSGTLKGDLELLETTRRQLEERVQLARTNVRLLNTAIMFKDNIELFEKLYGRYKLKELLRDPSKIEERVNEVLKEHGLSEVDTGAIAEYLNEMFPVIVRDTKEKTMVEGVREEAKPAPRVPLQVSKPPSQEVIEVSLDMLNYGEPLEWAKLIEEAAREGKVVKLPLVRDISGREGFKNLLVALYSTEVKPHELKKVFKDNKLLVRYIDVIAELKKGRELVLDVTDSRLPDVDELLKILCGEPTDTKVSEGEAERVVEKLYKFRDIGGREVTVTRKTVINKYTNRAKHVIVSLSTAT